MRGSKQSALGCGVSFFLVAGAMAGLVAAFLYNQATPEPQRFGTSVYLKFGGYASLGAVSLYLVSYGLSKLATLSAIVEGLGASVLLATFSAFVTALGCRWYGDPSSLGKATIVAPFMPLAGLLILAGNLWSLKDDPAIKRAGIVSVWGLRLITVGLFLAMVLWFTMAQWLVALASFVVALILGGLVLLFKSMGHFGETTNQTEVGGEGTDATAPEATSMCQICGGPLRATVYGQSWVYYRCPECGKDICNPCAARAGRAHRTASAACPKCNCDLRNHRR